MKLADCVYDLTVSILSIQLMRGLAAIHPSLFYLYSAATENVARILVVDDRRRTTCGIPLRELEGCLIGSPCDTDGTDSGHRSRPREIPVDEEVAVALGALDHVRCGDSRVLEDDLRIGGAALARFVDHVVRDAGRSPFDHDCGQALPAAGIGIGADDHQVEIRSVAIPACDVARPVLAAV